MTKIIKLSIILLLLFNIFSIGILAVSAEETANTGLLPTETGNGTCPAGSTNCGRYTLNDMVSVTIKISQLILGVVGSLALIAFVAGGLMMMLSGGKAEMVTRGKQTLIGAVIGLVIVFTSYMIIQLVYSSLGIEATKGGAWSTFTGTPKDWFK